MQLPQHLRDLGFQRHIGRLENAERDSGRDSAEWRLVLDEPWVTDHEFYGPDRETHCPHGHPGAHVIGYPPTNLAGRPHVRRRCGECDSVWFEPLP